MDGCGRKGHPAMNLGHKEYLLLIDGAAAVIVGGCSMH